MIHISNRSDFSIVWKMPNGGILPTFPYALEFSTRGGLRYTVKSDDESRFIPKPDADGQIRSAVIIFDFSNRPHLPSGRLMFTMKAAIPNNMYPDDYQDITEPHPTNVELWDGATDYNDAVEVELVLPYVKGDKGDAGEGVPTGGRKGQVLKKKSDADYDTTWSEGITDIAPGAVGTDELADSAVTEAKIADGAVTLSKLGGDVADKLNGYATKEDVTTVGNIAVRAASAAADAQTLADNAADAATIAGNVAKTAEETAKSAQIAASGAVRFDASQELTTAQQLQARTNITAMKNTPSGDPMHYMYETAGAEWIPYADISTEGLEDWQVATLNTAQAQADGGVWWHNDIFVSVNQNRINYILTIGTYPAQRPTYDLYLSSFSKATTNYKEQGIAQIGGVSFNDACRFTSLRTINISTISVNSCIRGFYGNNKLYRVLGTLRLNEITAVAKVADAFRDCPYLRDVNISGLNVNLNLSSCQQLRTNSVAYMITNAKTANITITLAPAVYTAAMADSAVQAALADKTNVTLANAGSNA